MQVCFFVLFLSMFFCYLIHGPCYFLLGFNVYMRLSLHTLKLAILLQFFKTCSNLIVSFKLPFFIVLAVHSYSFLFISAIQVEMRSAYPNQGPCPHQSKALMMVSCHRPATRAAPEMTNCYLHCLVQNLLPTIFRD